MYVLHLNTKWFLNILKRIGDKNPPCFTPLPIENLSDTKEFHLTCRHNIFPNILLNFPIILELFSEIARSIACFFAHAFHITDNIFIFSAPAPHNI